MVGCGFKNGPPTRHVSKMYWTMCSNMVDRYKFNSQQNWVKSLVHILKSICLDSLTLLA